MPFVIAQLANYDGRQQTGFPRPIAYEATPVNSSWAQLREAQRLVAKADPYAELAVLNDLGETVDIHPLRKKEAAERIGLCFDRLVFNNNKVKLSPEIIATEIKDGTIIFTLDQPIQAGQLFEFEIAGPARCRANNRSVFSDSRHKGQDCLCSILPDTILYR